MAWPHTPEEALKCLALITALAIGQESRDAANEQGDTLVTFRVDPSGMLAPTGQVIKNASPGTIVCTTRQ
jgi:hypothetical protein